jgi:hypothetical protein
MLRGPFAWTDAHRVALPPLQADCGEIREQLAVLRCAVPPRGLLRDHVERCDGCRAFAAEVRRQHAAMGVLLAVVPSQTLKHSTLAAAAAASGTAAMPGGADEGEGPRRHPPR